MVYAWEAGNPVVIEYYGARNRVTGVEDNGGSFQATLYDFRTGAPVPGQVWPLQLDPVGTGGRYQGTADATVEVVPGLRYELRVTGFGTNGEELDIRRVYPAVVRR